MAIKEPQRDESLHIRIDKNWLIAGKHKLFDLTKQLTI